MGEDRFVDEDEDGDEGEGESEGESEGEGGMGRKGIEFLVEGWKKEGK